MDSKSLKLFLHLAQSLHFSRTAEAMNLSPSALSRQIQQLEERLECKLFERDNRQVQLTPQGRKLQSYARESIEQWEAFRQDLNASDGELSGSVSLYCSVTASYSLLYQILKRFRQEHPKVEINLHTGDPADAIRRVLGGHEDLCITAKPEKLSKELSFHSMVHSPLLCLQAKKASIPTPKNDKDWAEVPLIIPETGLTRERLDAWFQKKKLKPNIYAQVSGHEAIVSMVALDLGLGFAPQIVVDNSPQAKQVKLVEKALPLGDYDVGICTRSKRLEKDRIIAAFWELLGEH